MAEQVNKSEVPIEREYFFPHHLKAIVATSKEEAVKKLEEMNKKPEINNKK